MDIHDRLKQELLFSLGILLEHQELTATQYVATIKGLKDGSVIWSEQVRATANEQDKIVTVSFINDGAGPETDGQA